MEPEHKKLNLGCGFKKLDDHWNVDVEAKCNPDEVVDLESFPWPWADNYFEKISADNILEHLGQNPKVFTQIIKEMYRVSADGAEWMICVPHHRCDLFFDDYTHVRVITPKTLKMFDQTVNFDSIKRKLSDSTFGIYHDVDIEMIDTIYNIVGYWKDQMDSGMLGRAQFDINLNTMSNVVESVTMFLKAHKPGRCQDLIKTIINR
jgi:predicted SAM-dependent methyltransferase